MTVANCVVFDWADFKKHEAVCAKGKRPGEIWGEEVAELVRKRKKEAEAAKAKKEERGAQFKVVTQPSEKIIQEGHPSGWVNRTQERVETANKGREWRSEA